MSWQVWWEELLNFIFPTRNFCLLCWQEYMGSPKRRVCPHCTELLINQAGAACPLCGRFKTTTEQCPNCYGLGLPGLAGVISVAPYYGQYRELIQNLKYGGKQELNDPLGYLMSYKLHQAFPRLKPDIIVPVPLEPHRQLARGFNQSALLAEVVGSFLQRPVVENCLFRGTGKASQTTLGRTGRMANTRDAFHPGGAGGLAGQVVLLIDDIVTTGSTLSACALVLQSLGAKDVWGLTWAAGGIRQNTANSTMNSLFNKN